jgi:hypothetical protein
MDPTHGGFRDDNEGAGTVKSFDASTRALVIDLFDSDTDVTGKVDSTTKIECDDENDDAPAPTTTSRQRDGADDDNSGGRQGDDDDEQGGRAEDDQQPGCDASALTAGRVVKEAKLNEGDDGPADVFHEIELAG